VVLREELVCECSRRSQFRLPIELGEPLWRGWISAEGWVSKDYRHRGLPFSMDRGAHGAEGNL